MKHTKRIVALFLTLVMVLGCIGVMPAMEAKAEEAVDLIASDIKVNYAEETLDIVSATTATKVYVTDKYDEKNPERAVWDVYKLPVAAEGKKTISIDIAGYTKVTANSVVYVKGLTEVYPVQVNKQETTLKAAFSAKSKVTVKGITEELSLTEENSVGGAETGYIYFTYKDGTTLKQYTDIKNLQWKKGATGTWKAMKALKLDNYTNRGTTLYFRIAPSEAAEIGDKNETTGVYVNEAGVRISNEAKVTVVKRAAAPAVAVNGANLTIGLKSGQEYKIDNGNWIDVKTAHGDANGKVGKITLYDLYTAYTDKDSKTAYTYNPANAFTISVRTAATAKKGVSKTKEITVNETKVASKTLDSNFKVDFVKKNVENSGYKFTNNSEYAVQVAVVSKAKVETEDSLDQKKVAKEAISWTTVKAKGTATIAYKNYSKLNDAIIIYRLATIKADATKDPVVKSQVASKAEILSAPTVKQAEALDVTLAAGSAVGTTKTTLTASEGNKIVYKISDAQVTSLAEETVISGGTVYTSEADITVAAGKYITFYEVNKTSNKAVKYKSIKVEEGNLKAAE